MFLAGVWAVDAVSDSHRVPNWLVSPNPPYSQAELYSPGTAEVYYSPFYSCSPGLSMSNTNVRQYCWDPAGVGVWNRESYTAPQRLINAACWSQLPYWLIGLKSGIRRVCFWEGERWGRVPERGFARRGWRGALCSVAVVSSTADQLKHTQGREHTSASILGSERWLKNTAWTACSKPGLLRGTAQDLMRSWNLNHSSVTLHEFFRCSQWACCRSLFPTCSPWYMANTKVSCI